MKFQSFILECTLKDHTLSVNALAFAPTSNYLASGSNDGTLIIWDPVTGLMKNHITFHNPILSLAWDPWHLKRLYVGCEDGTLALLNNSEAQEPCHTVLTGIKSSVFAISINEYGGSVAICIGPEVHLVKEITPGVFHVSAHWYVVLKNGPVRYASFKIFPSPRKCPAKLVDKHVCGRALSFTERGAKLIIAYLYHGVVCWDVNMSQCLWHINPIHGHQLIGHAALSSDHKRVVLSNLSEGVDMYLVGQSHPELHFKHRSVSEEKNVPLQVAFILGGSAVVSGSTDGKVPIWMATSGECMQLLEHGGHVVQAITAFEFPTCTLIAAATSFTEDETFIRLWKGKNDNVRKLKKHATLAHCYLRYMTLLETIVQMKTSIFNNDISDDDHQDQLDLGPANGAGRTAASANSDVIPNDNSAHPLAASKPAPTITKKRGQPSKKAQAVASKESELPLPKSVNIMYYLTIFSEAEMKKSEKQRKPSNTFLQTKSDCEWDTIKVQLLEKISQVLQPKLIDFNDYTVSWSVPHYQSSQMQLQTDDDYKFLITHALKPKEPLVNIKIETKIAKKVKTRPNDESGVENDTSDNTSDSGDSSDTSGDRWHAKKKTKKSKTKGSKKIVKETALNRDIDEKIKLLQSRWECLKAGCGTDHCFIHPKNSEHIPLSHNHFAIWVAAWQCGPQFADLEKLPNHAKFNGFHLGQLGETSPLLQRCVNECNQQPGSSAPIFNISVPQEVISIFCPPAAVAVNPAPSPPCSIPMTASGADSSDLLLPGLADPGPRLSLQQFCTEYSLSDAVYHKLNENGYTGSNTISYIRVSELKEMGFKHSEIAAMKDAVQQWVSRA